VAAELLSRADGPAWRLTIARPARRNAITPDLAAAMAAEVDLVSAARSAPAIVIDGEGGHFCAGLDLVWFTSLGGAPDLDQIRDGLTRFQSLIVSIVRAPVPVIAALRGSVAGFGVDLAAACDLRLAGRSTIFASAFARMGLVPDGGSSLTLRALIGEGAALRFLLAGEPLDAAGALRLGLVTEVVEDDALDARVAALAAAVAANAPGSTEAIKRLCRAETTARLEAVLRSEGEAQMEAMLGAEFRDRLRAFLSRAGASG